MTSARLTRVRYLDEQRRQFVERRGGFYHRHPEHGLIGEVQRSIANREAPDIATLKRYFAIGLERTRGIIADFEGRFGRRDDPETGDYGRAIKECVDSRPMVTTILDLLGRTHIHERTAGSVVRRGHIFKVLDPDGIGVVMAHSRCGGDQVAHDYHSGRLKGDGDPVFDHIRSIADAIPRDVALKEGMERTRGNAHAQIERAVDILDKAERGNSVYPILFHVPEGTEDPRVEWLSESQKRPIEWVKQMDANARMLWRIACELGRTAEHQFAVAILFYDPYRMGRFDDPRSLLDMLPNEGFCPTENFRGLMEGQGLSNSAVVSLRYAGFLNGGHVTGVGGPRGNRLVIVIDPDPAVTIEVEKALLASAPDIRDLSRNGETIVRARYDLQTRDIEFLD